MKTADNILKTHEDDNEYHFHDVDRGFIIAAMKEYAKACIKELISRKNKETVYTILKGGKMKSIDSIALDLMKELEL